MKNETKSVLVVAYACEPNKTSEPGVGWNFIQEIAKVYNTTVLTRANNREAVEGRGDASITYIYYDLPKIFLLMKKSLPLGTQAYYALWQWGGYLHTKKSLQKIGKRVDILHHLNFGITWITPPAFLFKTPFVWGPIGGGDTVPFNYLKNMNLKAIVQESFYATLNGFTKISPLSYFVKRKSSAILFRTTTAKNKLGSVSAIVQTLSETASPDRQPHQPKKASKQVHAICVGRMNYWKGYILAVQGFHRFLQEGGKGTLEIFGEGPEKKSLESYIRANQLNKHILIKGFVDNELIKVKMKQATVLLHPSFREGGSWSIMEAMSYGLPVICLNTSGPKDMVTKECGILIDLTSETQTVEKIGKGLLELSQNFTLYETMSTRAINRIATEYSWNRRRKQIIDVYDRVLMQNN